MLVGVWYVYPFTYQALQLSVERTGIRIVTALGLQLQCGKDINLEQWCLKKP